jgi:hypothetical protein
MKFEIIPVAEVRVSPRGRKTTYNEELIKALKSLKEGQAIKLGELYGNVAKKDRASVAQNIRKHWRAAREDECRIDWDSATGIAQVQMKVRK